MKKPVLQPNAETSVSRTEQPTASLIRPYLKPGLKLSAGWASTTTDETLAVPASQLIWTAVVAPLLPASLVRVKPENEAPFFTVTAVTSPWSISVFSSGRVGSKVVSSTPG